MTIQNQGGVLAGLFKIRGVSWDLLDDLSAGLAFFTRRQA